MWPILPIMMLAGGLLGLGFFPGAWAQDDPAQPVCPPGENCEAVTQWGSWGLIFLGLLFFALWFVPPRAVSEEDEGLLSRIPMVQVLQRRIDMELTGWRRFQWPVLGLFFILLGVATLAGWR